MGSSTTTQDTTSNQINQIPQWMSDAGQQNYAYAQNVAMQPLQQYQGQMVADVSPQMQQAWNVAANSGNVGSDQFNAATSGYLNAIGQTPTNIIAGQLKDTNLDPYMNPYTKDVINATLPLMQQQNAIAQNQQANQANSAKAFGGSRQGIQQGVAQAQGALNIGQMAAQLNQANFAQAQAGATGDINRNLTAAQSNQTADQAKINSDILASQGLTNTGQQMNASNVANYNMLMSAGAAEQMQAQNQINAQMAKFNQAFNYPQQQLGVLESSLGMTPHDTSTSGQSSTATTTPTDWASLIKGGGEAAAGIFSLSDKSMKTDITKLGKDPKTGVQMHAFRYKGDPKSYPKVVGPMAQEVQEKYPNAVEEVGEKGKLAIKGYAGGTSMVPPSLASFVPPSSPGVAKGIGALSAFVPRTRTAKGAGVPKIQRFAFGTADVPNMDDVELGSEVMGGPAFGGGDGDMADKIRKITGGLSKAAGGASPSGGSSSAPQMPPGWGSPSMGYFRSGYARGVSTVPTATSGMDTVPAMLTPGEAVLTPRAAQHLGRGNIAKLNAFMPPVGMDATAAPRAGARGIHGALANTKLRPKVAGGLASG